jgi:hypothetical protein
MDSGGLTPIDHLGDPHGLISVEPNAVGLPPFLSEGDRYFDGSRRCSRGKPR